MMNAIIEPWLMLSAVSGKWRAQKGGNNEFKQKGSNDCGSVARWQVNVVLSTLYVVGIGLSGYSIFKGDKK